ncbi:unnamed protein product, partial [Menidia menidia]
SFLLSQFILRISETKFNMKKAVFLIRDRAGSCGQALKSLLCYIWDAYSTPTPSRSEALALLCVCLAFSTITGGLLHHWLSETLEYSREVSVRTSGFYGVAIFLLSFLCHPLRCVLTLILPTVCTKQGRKLLASASVVVLVLNVVPNITTNVGAAAHVLKCTAEGFSRTLLNSSESFNVAKQDLVEEAMKMTIEDASIVSNLRTLNLHTHVDVSEVKGRFAAVIAEIAGNFSHARNLLREGKLLSNRILAAVFVALLIIESARYLASYLTSVHFDNGSLHKELGQKNSHAGNKRQTKIKINVCKITSQECTSCVISMVVVTLYFIAIALMVVLDHVVYYFVQMILPWVLDFPPTTASINVSYKVSWFPPASCIVPQWCKTQELTNFNKDYKWNFDPEPSLCNAPTSAPNMGVTLLLGCLWLTSYFLVFLEVYARRLRRKICASFFREQEEKRTAYFMSKIEEKRDKMKKEALVTADVSVRKGNGTPLTHCFPGHSLRLC